MINDTVILYGKTKLPADDCKVIFKDKKQSTNYKRKVGLTPKP